MHIHEAAGCHAMKLEAIGPLDSTWPCWGHNQLIKVFRNLHLRPPSPLHASKPRQSSESPTKSLSKTSATPFPHLLQSLLRQYVLLQSYLACWFRRKAITPATTQWQNVRAEVIDVAKGDFQYEIKLGVGSPTTWRCRSRASQFRLPTFTQLEDCWTGWRNKSSTCELAGKRARDAEKRWSGELPA